MEHWVLVIVYFANGAQNLRGPFSSEAECLKGMAALSQWSVQLPEPVYHLSQCKRLSEIDARLEDMET
jgi:hypothetical protein